MSIVIKQDLIEPGTECLLSSFVNYFVQNGIDLTEEQVCFMGEGFRTSFSSSRFLLRSYIHEAIKIFCKKTGIDEFVFYHNDSTQLYELIQQVSNQNMGIIVKMDASFLKYKTAFGQSKGVPHYILIEDYSNDMCLINDSYIATFPPSCYRGWLTYEAICEGNNAGGGKFITIEKEAVSSLKECSLIGKSKDLNELVKKAIIDYICSKPYITYNDQKVVWGAQAYCNFADELYQRLDDYPSNTVKSLIGVSKDIRIWGFLSTRALVYKSLDHITNYQTSFQLLSNETIVESINKMCFQMIKTGISQKSADIKALQECLLQYKSVEINELKKILELL